MDVQWRHSPPHNKGSNTRGPTGIVCALSAIAISRLTFSMSRFSSVASPAFLEVVAFDFYSFLKRFCRACFCVHFFPIHPQSQMGDPPQILPFLALSPLP